MKLSEQAWVKSAKIIEAIQTHAFNKELATGELGLDKFSYYIEQDSIYLQDFIKAQAMIAAKIQQEYVSCFLKYANETCVAEQEIVHHFFEKIYNLKKTGKRTPALLSYTSYLLRTGAIEPVEVAVAAVLPCFWVYQIIGLSIVKNTDEKNPYFKWIETYSSDEFAKVVQEIITIFDSLALQASEDIKAKMLQAFYTSVCLEWHFWNDAYNKIAFDEIMVVK